MVKVNKVIYIPFEAASRHLIIQALSSTECRISGSTDK